jgi:hypothetical protein
VTTGSTRSSGTRSHRIWSTAFYRDPEGETARVAAAWRAAVGGVEDPVPEVAAPGRFEAVLDEEDDGLADPVDDEPVEDGDVAGGRTGDKPVAGDGRPITAYTDDELVALIGWIESDTRLRTDDELLEDAVLELGYARQGTRITERLRKAIAMARADEPGD